MNLQIATIPAPQLLLTRLSGMIFSSGALEGATSGTAACATTDAFRAATILLLGTTAALAGPWAAAAENLASLLLLLLLPAANAIFSPPPGILQISEDHNGRLGWAWWARFACSWSLLGSQQVILTRFEGGNSCRTTSKPFTQFIHVKLHNPHNPHKLHNLHSSLPLALAIHHPPHSANVHILAVQPFLLTSAAHPSLLLLLPPSFSCNSFCFAS